MNKVVEQPIRTPRDLAAALKIDYSSLIYWGRHKLKSTQYKTFALTKKSGGNRIINTPVTNLKLLQKGLSTLLSCHYSPRICAHGFIVDRSIVTNAKRHEGNRFVLNVDLKDFFPSINFGRVFGALKSWPFKFDPHVASLIANICTLNNELPQGAPSSPILSNIICHKLDGELLELAKEARCIYTRYADDLTFSTSLRGGVPTDLYKNSRGTGMAGLALKSIIESNGFQINTKKVWYRGPHEKKQVTGLTVNKLTNVDRKFVRKIRGMLHAWEKYGFLNAQKTYYEKYNKRQRTGDYYPLLHNVIRGNISFLIMVKGHGHELAVRTQKKWESLFKSISFYTSFPLCLTLDKS